MKILVIDNYDSFTYNLVHYIENITGQKVDVYRNDEIKLEEIKVYDKILLSPGPGIPTESGICLDLIREYAPKKSILGVCLGHQAITEAFGGSLINLDKVYHGVSTPIDVITPENYLYQGIPARFDVGRYHSWVSNPNNFPSELTITAKDESGLIMGLSHKKYDVQGVQYHPESVLTQNGMKIMENWISHIK
jgi:anthranilate synthase component II